MKINIEDKLFYVFKLKIHENTKYIKINIINYIFLILYIS